jgi:hypothetical protein
MVLGSVEAKGAIEGSEALVRMHQIILDLETFQTGRSNVQAACKVQTVW